MPMLLDTSVISAAILDEMNAVWPDSIALSILSEI
jgi:hypothetical protein